MASSNSLDTILKFDNTTLKKLPIDSNKDNYVRQVKDACFSLVLPSPLENPQLLAYSKDALKLIGVPDNILDCQINSLTPYLCGNKLFRGSQPAAHCYCGHQFGNFAGQLGDGAAMYLGEVINENNEKWEIQLKGSGKTPFSRTADGRKVLRSSLREFLCSEAMHYLGVPTTRAGSVVTSDTLIERDMFYDGNTKLEKCSVVLRIAETFIRFGSFEICKTLDSSTGRMGPSLGNNQILKTLLEFVIEQYYPEIWNNQNLKNPEEKYELFFKEIVRRTAKLVAMWQTVGFCHGVLNTDNMSIVGVTIDYGPFGFLDKYDPSFICNSSDNAGRYSYENQPDICKWNCRKLAEALHKLIPLEDSNRIISEIFDITFQNDYNDKMAKKIGFSSSSNEIEELVKELLDTMYKTGSDFTNTFLVLEKILPEIHNENKLDDHLNLLLKQTSTIEEIKKIFKPTLSRQERQFFWTLAGNNRDKLLEMGGQFIIKEEEKEKKFEEYEKMTPDDKEKGDKEIWKIWLLKYHSIIMKDWERRNNLKNSIDLMKSNNPRIILRNYIAQLAITAAEEHNDFSVAQKLLDNYLRHPYNDIDEVQLNGDCKIDGVCIKPPSWSSDLLVS